MGQPRGDEQGRSSAATRGSPPDPVLGAQRRYEVQLASQPGLLYDREHGEEEGDTEQGSIELQERQDPPDDRLAVKQCVAGYESVCRKIASIERISDRCKNDLTEL